MILIDKASVLIGFSERSDGDLSFYNATESEGIKKWNLLDFVADRQVEFPAFCCQVHSNIVVELSRPFEFNKRQNSDAIVTAEKKFPIGVFTADCLPVMLWTDKCCAAIHAGWRGTLDNIVSKAIDKLIAIYGVPSSEIKAYLGPCIEPCCFEVGSELYENFCSRDNDYEQFFFEGDKLYLNIRDLNKFQLVQMGVKPENIFSITNCTFCHEGYYSFRRDKQRNGSMFNFIMLK